MKLFAIEAGTEAFVLVHGGRGRVVQMDALTTQAEVVFTREEMTFDPVSWQNEPATRPAAGTHEDNLVRRGYCGVRFTGKQTGKDYTLAVQYNRLRLVS